MKKILILILVFLSLLNASGKTEQAGDILMVLIPIVAVLPSIYMQDTDAQIEFLKAYESTKLLTQLLKVTVRERRPNGESTTSFPSGHTSSAFSGATFIHKKYGFYYALPAYVGAVYTGYSRVHAKKHYTHDVIAGAVLGMGLSWYFTTPYDEGMKFTPLVSSGYYGLTLDYKW